MNLNELKNEYERLQKVIDENYNGNHKTFSKAVKESLKIGIEINKLNHCYWDREDWIYDAINTIEKRPDLTGNALTEYYANELNKFNGVMLEKELIEDNTVNYTVMVITPYYSYMYNLKRGYDGHCKLEKYTFAGRETNKARTYLKVAKEHICEIVYGTTLEVLRTECERDILDKKLG